MAEVADRALVMYAGRVECGTLDDIFYDPQHPYTWGLLDPSHDWTSRASPAAVGAGRSAVADLPPEGCHFRPRRPHEFAKCAQVPDLANACPSSRSTGIAATRARGETSTQSGRGRIGLLAEVK